MLYKLPRPLIMEAGNGYLANLRYAVSNVGSVWIVEQTLKPWEVIPVPPRQPAVFCKDKSKNVEFYRVSFGKDETSPKKMNSVKASVLRKRGIVF